MQLVHTARLSAARNTLISLDANYACLGIQRALTLGMTEIEALQGAQLQDNLATALNELERLERTPTRVSPGGSYSAGFALGAARAAVRKAERELDAFLLKHNIEI